MPDTTETKTGFKEGSFVILTGAVVARVGEDKDAVQKFVRGQVVTLSNEFTDIRQLLRLKAIAKAVPGKSYQATTAHIARTAAGASDDPVQAPVEDIQPIDPQNTETTASEDMSAAADALAAAQAQS